MSLPEPINNSIVARASGKVIISGEHAIIYGAPALVAGVARYSTVRFTPHREHHLRTLLKDFSADPVSYPLNRLKHFCDRLDRHFEEFLAGRRPIKNILSRPDDLLAYSLASLAKRVLPLRGRLETSSELPLGAGMGSSAAIIAAALLIHEHLSRQPLSPDERFRQIRFCERLQHGRGSALDAAAVTYGGLLRVENDQPQPRDYPLENFYYLLDGIPQSSTGECVAQVRQRFASDLGLWQEFAAVINDLDKSLGAGQSPVAALRANQRLLERLGVVPEGTRQLIRQLEATGATVKISGAGSVRGGSGGMLLVYQPDPQAWADFLNVNPGRFAGRLELARGGPQLLRI